ncbi:MAG: hypothetical protein ACNA7W_14110 [Pseudomonadales bacterium]
MSNSGGLNANVNWSAWLASLEAHAWWKCPSGHSIQLRNNNTEIRCYRAARTLTRAINTDCPQMQTAFGPVGAAGVR